MTMTHSSEMTWNILTDTNWSKLNVETISVECHFYHFSSKNSYIVSISPKFNKVTQQFFFIKLHTELDYITQTDKSYEQV